MTNSGPLQRFSVLKYAPLLFAYPGVSKFRGTR